MQFYIALTLLEINNFVSLSSDSGWKNNQHVVDQYWMSGVRNMNQHTDTEWVFTGLWVWNATAHSVLWPILPTAVTTITWPSRRKIKNTKPVTIFSPCLVHLSPQHLIRYQKLLLFFSNLISIERASLCR